MLLGEIAFLTQLCQPIASLVTITSASHLEGLKSVSAVAQEKQEIYLKSPQAFWVFNKDNPYTKKMWQELGRENSIYFSSQDEKAHVKLNFVKESIQKSKIKGRIGKLQSTAELSFSDRKNLDNLMGACALALAVGAKPEQIWKSISGLSSP